MNKSSNIENIHPLSPLQQGILFHAAYDPDSDAYFEQLSCTIRGPLNTGALRRAWEAVVDRHAILRTGFFWHRRETPLQVVLRKVAVPWDQQDWRNVSPTAQRQQLDAYLEADRRQGFELSKAPLMRVALIRSADDAYYLIWSHHHLLLDGWSVPLVLKEVFGFYDAFRSNREIDLGRSNPYREYITWLRKQDRSKADEFWRQTLDGFTAPTPLPIDRTPEYNNGERQSYDEQEIKLTGEVTAALRLKVQQHSLTLNTLVQAAWGFLLSCYSGQRDVLFGAVVSGRPASIPGVESMVGLFINTLPVRIHIVPDATLFEWLQQLQRQQTLLQQYEYSSLVDIQGVSRVPRGVPLFNSIFVFENYPIQSSALLNPSIEITDIRVFERTNYPLTVSVVPGPELALHISYERGLFEVATIERMLAGLRNLLEAVLVYPDKQVAELADVLGLDYRKSAEKQLSSPPRPYAPELSVSRAQPHTRAIEELIAKAWSEVLGIEQVNSHDNFFELGGHSLLAMRVISRLQDDFRCELPVKLIFESPTVAELALKIESLTRRATAEESGETKQTRVGSEFPLSFSQQRLWFIDQLDPGNRAYNLPDAVRINGPLSVNALNDCLNEIVRRHEVLRTTFAIREGRLVQVIREPVPLEMAVIDVRGLCEAKQESEVDPLMLEESGRAFDLRRGPLLRAALLKTDEQHHVVLFTMHHIVADAWSAPILIRELGELYKAFVAGLPSPLPELPLQYADFAVWQRKHIEGGLMQAQLSYWKQQLDGIPAVLQLPTDRPRPAVHSYRGSSCSVLLSESLTEQLKQTSRHEGTTPFVILLTVFKVLLMRYCGEQDIVVGVPVAGRPRAEFENLIGFFVNNLVIRSKLAPAASFLETMKSEKEVVVGALAHQDVPFEKIVDELRPERSLSHSPLFQVAFNFLAMAIEETDLDELSIRAVESESGTARFDLVLAVVECDGGFSVALRYLSDLFDEATVEKMLAHFQALLEDALKNPARSIATLQILTPEEKQQLLLERSQTRAPLETDLLIHNLVEKQASESPDAVALICENNHVSYDALNRRANQLARHLQSLGEGPESIVGIFMERSPEMLVAVLGTLKAGAAYLPIDPLYPADRISLVLDDVRAAALLTLQPLAGRLPKSQSRIVFVDGDWKAIAAQSDENLISEVAPDNLAYVIHTSGSTGQPKGVMVTHSGLGNLAHAQIRAFGVRSSSRVLQFAPFTFDASVSEIFTALTKGAALCLAGRQRLLPGSELIELLRDEQIDVVTLPPTVLSALAGEDLPALRNLIAAGENCSAEIVQRWAPGRRFLNAYGPTESTVCATIAEISDTGRKPSIGRPIQNTEVYLADAHHQPVPDGVIGEIYIGGIGLARGYLNRPELTAARFIPNPFAVESGARVYRTGDLARWLREGAIDYIGRADLQVKVRGYRIELGEIEATLKRYAGVVEAVAAVSEDSTGEKLLAAYVVSSGETALDARRLRNHLAERLPEYMLPHHFIMLDKAPLLSNGKVDRRALPSPHPLRPGPETTYQAPRSELEALLVRMWQDVLGIERIGVFDQFFELGGDSIRGAIFINTLQEALREVVYVVVLFDAPTIAQLAEYLRQNYPEAVARVCGDQIAPEAQSQKIDSISVARVRDLIRSQSTAGPGESLSGSKAARTVFILSPPRSGSTLLRTMLGGHPRLFAPPELELLSFNTLEQRRAALSGRNSFWKEGLIRALMEIGRCGAEEATRLAEQSELDGMTTQQFYKQIQEWLGNRVLVDKTPSYALDFNVLKRAEEYFESPLYIHLLRHPCGMINSFVEAKLDQVFFRYKHDFTRREIAELIWIISQQNIIDFLAAVPEERQFRVKFEDLTMAPLNAIERMSEFLGIEPCEAMLNPYDGDKARMTDGIHRLSRMLGDIKFHEHRSIDENVAERWRETQSEGDLGEVTWCLAERLGYEKSTTKAAEPALSDRHPARTWVAIKPIDRPTGTRLPLSFAQQRLWFLNRLDPVSSAYNIPLIVRMIGTLDVTAFEKSINEIVRRHEVLRTTFIVADGQPMQVAAPWLRLRAEITDLSGVAGEEQEISMRRCMEEVAGMPFDLEKGPLLRAHIVRLTDTNHVVTVVMHHIVGDEWSVEIFVNEMAALYEAFVEGKPSPLEPLPVQYADFAVWQREWLRGDVLQSQLSYWRQQVEGAPAVLALPADRPRPPVQSFRGSSNSLTLDEALAEQARQLSRKEGITLFVTTLAAFKVLLMRYTGERDIVVGVPVAGRNRAEVEGLIGFFINALVVRTRLSPQAGFLNALRCVKEVSLGAFAHQDLPFDKLVDEIQPERSTSHSPIFQVAFNYLSQTAREFSLPGISFGEVEFEMGTAKYDLVFGVADSGGRLSIHMRYSTDLFDRVTIDRMLGHFKMLLAGAVADPGRRISTLPLLAPAEERQLLIERNDTERFLTTDLLIQDLVGKQAASSPAAVAMVYEETHLTYGELNQRANRLANYLRALGAGPETIVGICMKGCPEMIVSMLGVLKAGGAYLPLDPEYPVRRLAAIIEDSSIPLLITREDLEERLPAYSGQLVLIDSDLPRIELSGDEAPSAGVLPGNLAYVIYTSGSTGKPKGVQITHRGLLNLVLWHLGEFNVATSDRATQIAGVGFDACVWEIWPYLAAGASLSIAPDSIRISPSELRDWLAASQTTVAFLATPLAESSLALNWPVESSLRVMLTGGDKLHHHPSTRLPFALVNNYGPTENTVVTTSAVIEEKHGVTDEAPSIGRPIYNTRVYALSPELELQPDRVAGELHIGGASLARSYLLDSVLTAQKFIPDPFSDEPGARLYRSGDLARFRPDGAIDFLGRIDDQVKVRGFRIETGDIEAALAQHPDLLDVVAVAREDVPGETRLVAYVVPDPNRSTASSEIRAFLKEKLPEYMIPATIVLLDVLPLTPNGKVDRDALPAPDYTHVDLGGDRVAPRTDLELFLARKWSEVLGIEEIGVYDSFFDMGGESLKAAVLVNDIQQALGEMLQVVTIFDAPTVAGFAAYLERHCPDAVAKLSGNERGSTAEGISIPAGPVRKVDRQRIEQMRRLIIPQPSREPRHVSATKNPRAVFVLSAPRSGSTLLRVMLGGHPMLFAPPELELLSFNTLAARRAAFSGRDSFWQEGLIRALMEVKQCGGDKAREIIEEYEGAGLGTQQFYGLMQEWLGGRMLVDKTPSYAIDPQILKRAETDFDQALYIHLVRSPQGMIRSYEEAKLDQIFPRFKHPFHVRELAEIIWVISHQNILDFLDQVSPNRHHRVRFEDLVRDPVNTVQDISRFMGIEFHPEMVEPYKDKERKMTDGVHRESRMLGDIKFHRHSAIDSNTAESWRDYFEDDFLGNVTWGLAESFGYFKQQPHSMGEASGRQVLAPIKHAHADPDIQQTLEQLNSLSDEQVDSLLNQMLNEVHGN